MITIRRKIGSKTGLPSKQFKREKPNDGKSTMSIPVVVVELLLRGRRRRDDVDMTADEPDI